MVLLYSKFVLFSLKKLRRIRSAPAGGSAASRPQLWLPGHAAPLAGRKKRPKPLWGSGRTKPSAVPPEFAAGCRALSPGNGGDRRRLLGNLVQRRGSRVPSLRRPRGLSPAAPSLLRSDEDTPPCHSLFYRGLLYHVFPPLSRRSGGVPAFSPHFPSSGQKRASTASLSRITCSFTASREAILRMGRRKRYTVSAISWP